MLYIEFIMTDSSFCQQRAIKQLYNVPLTRFNLDSINPYLSGKYTKTQLDMRRKVEILKYSSNKVAGQTNNLTKNQRFALLARGGLQSPSQAVLKSKTNTCESDRTIPTPTSSCDVPGPVIYLQADNTVPLYNYSVFNSRSFPEYVPTDTDAWRFVVLPDVAISKFRNIVGDTAHYLIIKDAIDQPQYTYNVIVPVGIDFSGISTSITPVPVSMNSATLNVYYNGNLVNSVTITSQLPSFTITPSASSGAFSGKLFFGTLQFSRLTLYTAPTYVYSFSLQTSMNISASLDYDVKANTTISQTATSGCSVTNLTASYNPGAFITPV